MAVTVPNATDATVTTTITELAAAPADCRPGQADASRPVLGAMRPRADRNAQGGYRRSAVARPTTPECPDGRVWNGGMLSTSSRSATTTDKRTATRHSNLLGRGRFTRHRRAQPDDHVDQDHVHEPVPRCAVERLADPDEDFTDQRVATTGTTVIDEPCDAPPAVIDVDGRRSPAGSQTSSRICHRHPENSSAPPRRCSRGVAGREPRKRRGAARWPDREHDRPPSNDHRPWLE